MKVLVITFVVFILTLSGCASTTETFFPLVENNESFTNVKVFRGNVPPTKSALNIYIDGKKAARLANESEVNFSVEKGVRNLKFRFVGVTDDWLTVNNSVDFSDKQNYEIEVKGESEIREWKNSFNYTIYRKLIIEHEGKSDFVEEFIKVKE